MAVFNIDQLLQTLEGDVNAVRRLRDKDITGVTGSGQFALDDLDRSRGIASGNLTRQQLGSLQSAQDQMALRGGLSAGANERLARRNLNQGAMAQQGLFSDFAGLRNDAMMQNLGMQEAQKFQSMMAVPGMETGITNSRIAAKAANDRAEALRQARKGNIFSGILGGLGGVVGGVFGGPAGASAGASIGSGIGGIFG